MTKDNEAGPNKVGIIPDFFHDIIAYIIPGYTALILFVCNLYIIGLLEISFIKDFDLKGFSLSLLVAYVIGRFFEEEVSGVKSLFLTLRKAFIVSV